MNASDDSNFGQHGFPRIFWHEDGKTMTVQKGDEGVKEYKDV